MPSDHFSWITLECSTGSHHFLSGNATNILSCSVTLSFPTFPPATCLSTDVVSYSVTCSHWVRLLFKLFITKWGPANGTEPSLKPWGKSTACHIERVDVDMFEPCMSRHWFSFVITTLVVMLVVIFHTHFVRCFSKAVTVFVGQVHSTLLFHNGCIVFHQCSVRIVLIHFMQIMRKFKLLKCLWMLIYIQG